MMMVPIYCVSLVGDCGNFKLRHFRILCFGTAFQFQIDLSPQIIHVSVWMLHLLKSVMSVCLVICCSLPASCDTCVSDLVCQSEHNQIWSDGINKRAWTVSSKSDQIMNPICLQKSFNGIKRFFFLHSECPYRILYKPSGVYLLKSHGQYPESITTIEFQQSLILQLDKSGRQFEVASQKMKSILYPKLGLFLLGFDIIDTSLETWYFQCADML